MLRIPKQGSTVMLPQHTGVPRDKLGVPQFNLSIIFSYIFSSGDPPNFKRNISEPSLFLLALTREMGSAYGFRRPSETSETSAAN